MESIAEIKERFKNEWVLVEVLEKNNLNLPVKGRLITHSRSRDDTYDAMIKIQGKHLYHFYTGEIPKKDYAVIFEVVK